MKLLVHYLSPLKKALFWGFSIKILASVLELLLPYILSYILDSVVPAGEMKMIFFWGGMMILAALGAYFGNVAANRNAARVARDASRAIRHDLFEATMHLSSREVDGLTVPSLESRLTSDTYHLHHFIGMIQRIGVRAPMLLIGGIAITFFLDARLALILLATLPVIGVSIFFITGRGLPLYQKAHASVDGMVRVVREDCGGVRVIKALSREQYEKERYDAANRKLVADETRAGVTMALTQPLMGLFLNLGLVLVIFAGAYLVDRDLSKPGKIIAFIQYFTLMSSSIAVLTRIFVDYSRSLASARRIDEVLSVYHAHKESPDTGDAATGEIALEFRDVSFAYGEKYDTVSHISFSLERGKTLGIIGATGAGKSTLLRLAMRFYEAKDGEILVDGLPIAHYGEAELHKKFGVVMQSDFIAADTVAENIRFGREISEEKVRRAAALAQAAEYIEAFPDGYEHMLSAKGTNLSGGQRQRLLIARALAGDPEFLVLDDASSALDYKTDAALRRTVREALCATTIVVAQRVSSVMYADLILVLDRGRIIGAGKHDELLENCALYREISESQMGGAILE